MAESAAWLVEDGIGETRALLVAGDEVLAARLHWPGELVAGETWPATLTAKAAGARRGTARIEGEGTGEGREVLVDQLAANAREGARGCVQITRAAIAERGRLKRAQGRWLNENTTAARSAGGTFLPDARRVRNFEAGAWEEVWLAASSGTLEFAGGAILCSVTPAMTVIDVDGDLPPRALALASVPAIVRALRLFDCGGNIAIDFPTLQAKADRRAVDDALENALAGWPHERTAMNGFGLVQIVARLDGPSLLHRFAVSRTGMCARAALRAAERAEGAGATLITVHPAIRAKFTPAWLEELRRRTGREVRIESDPGLAIEAPNAQIVSA